jgi:serpin B
MHRHHVVLCLGSIALLACGEPSSPETTAPTPAETRPGPVEPAEPVAPVTPEPAPVAPLAPDAARGVGRAVNGLAADLMARLAQTRGNLAFSPASVEAALAMTAGGARGATADEMRRTLHLESDAAIDDVGRALRSWDDPARQTYTLRVANRLFGEDRFVFEQPYLDRVASTFAAPLERLDFQGAPDAQRTHINQWVAERTEDRIRDLLPSGAIVSDTRLVLVNAVYLDAQWEEPFDSSATRPDAFRVDGGTSAQVPTMHRTAAMQHGVIDGATVIELGYRGGDLAMRFVLPPEGAAPEAWATEAHLSDATVLAPVRVALSLPKFRIEGDTVPLRDHLEALGIRLAFTNEADFSGIAAPPSPDDRLHIDAVFHKAFVRVDEQGTEAAAATAVTMMRAGGPPPQEEEPIVVRFDRPFLFVLRDVRTGAVLFLGRVADPR